MLMKRLDMKGHCLILIEDPANYGDKQVEEVRWADHEFGECDYKAIIL